MIGDILDLMLGLTLTFTLIFFLLYEPEQPQHFGVDGVQPKECMVAPDENAGVYYETGSYWD